MGNVSQEDFRGDGSVPGAPRPPHVERSARGPHRWHPDLPPRPRGCPSRRVSEVLPEADLALDVWGFSLVVLVSPWAFLRDRPGRTLSHDTDQWAKMSPGFCFGAPGPPEQWASRSWSVRIFPSGQRNATKLHVFGTFLRSPLALVLSQHHGEKSPVRRQRGTHGGPCLADHLQRHHQRHPVCGHGGLRPRGRRYRPGGRPARV